MPYQTIDYRLDRGVAIIRLNQPDTLNAMSLTMATELAEAFKHAAMEARAIVIGATGRAFCSGANLNEPGFDLADPQRDIGQMLESTFNPLIETLRDMPIPVVTAVKGAAAGIGCSIALMGDLIVAGQTTYFLQAFRNIGLVPDGGSAYILSRAIGRVRAMEMMLLGKKLPAPQAFTAGLITRLVEDDAVDQTALDLAQDLAAGPTLALGAIRRAAWAALDSTFGEQLARERVQQRDACRTQDFVEGVAAFREKRPAQFKGR